MLQLDEISLPVQFEETVRHVPKLYRYDYVNERGILVAMAAEVEISEDSARKNLVSFELFRVKQDAIRKGEWPCRGFGENWIVQCGLPKLFLGSWLVRAEHLGLW